MQQSKFAFIESNTTGTGELLIHEAQSLKYYPIFLTRDPKKYSFLEKLNVEIIIIDTLDQNALLRYLVKIPGLKGIYTSSEYFIETAARLAKHFNLPSTNPKAIKLCRNKYALYQKLARFDLNCPKTTIIDNLAEAEANLIEYTFPIIIKPNDLSGSVGVKLCKDTTASLAHINFLMQQNINAILLQEYIEGPEYSVETYSNSDIHRIIGITQKYLGTPPHFVETGHDFPALLPTNEYAIILENIPKLLAYLDFDFGFAHIELKIKNGRIFIIEANPRLAGGMIPILIEKSTGINLLTSLIHLYTGHPFEDSIVYNRFSAIRHLIPVTSGQITRLDYKGPNSDIEIKLVKHTGDTVILQGDYRDRIAYIIVSDTDLKRCQDKAAQALKNFLLEIRD